MNSGYMRETKVSCRQDDQPTVADIKAWVDVVEAPVEAGLTIMRSGGKSNPHYTITFTWKE